MSHNKQIRSEQRALKFSLYGTIYFVALALSFALLTNSDAILFDGIASLITFSTTLLTMKVAKLAERPDDEQFHFGYTAMEPTLNLFKSLIVIVVCVFAVIQAVKRLMAGGNPAEYGMAIVYGVVATIGYFAVAWLMYRTSRDKRSDLVRVEAKTWFVDGLLSGGILLGFVMAWWLEQSTWAQYAPLVDPILLISLVVIALPIPIKIMLDSLKEVIAMAPPELVVDEIKVRLLQTLDDIDYDDVELRVTKRGRNTYLLVHVVVSENFLIASIADLDKIRHRSEGLLKTWNPEIVMDILFVRDQQLAN